MNSRFPALPQNAFTASDVVALYLHRGAFENALADPRPGTRPRPLGQPYGKWSRGVANRLSVAPRTSGWSWAMCLSQPRYALPCLLPRSHLRTRRPPRRLLFRGTGRQKSLCAGRAGRFSGRDFALQPDGTLRCPAKQSLVVHERRREADGSLRVVYAASIRSCRPCPLRQQCQWNGSATTKPRQVSV